MESGDLYPRTPEESLQAPFGKTRKQTGLHGAICLMNHRLTQANSWNLFRKFDVYTKNQGHPHLVWDGWHHAVGQDTLEGG